MSEPTADHAAMDSQPRWYVVARCAFLEHAGPFIVSGPYPAIAEAQLQCQRATMRSQDLLEFTIADIRFVSDDPLFAPLIQAARQER